MSAHDDELARILLVSLERSAASAATLLSPWQRSLRIIFCGTAELEPTSKRSVISFSERLQDSPFDRPGSLAAARDSVISELLSDWPAIAKRARVANGWARAWHQRFGDDSDAVWAGDEESWGEIRASASGLTHNNVARLRAELAHERIIPPERGFLRLAIRHGWLHPLDAAESAVELASVFLGRWPADTPPRPGQVLDALDDVVAKFCRARCQCAECPLQPLLPPGGAIEPSQAE